MVIQYFTILFFGISPGEFFIILLVVLILFGPRKIPEIVKTLGRGYNELKKAQHDLNTEIQSYTDDIEKETQKFQNEVKSVLDEPDYEKKPSKQYRKDKDDDKPDKADEKTNTDIDDDLPYPYKKNRNLKA